MTNTMYIYNWYKLSRWMYIHKIPFIPILIKVMIRILWGVVIPYQANIGRGTLIGYQGIGVVIHKKAVIGKNCHISQNVTIGANAVVLKDIPDNAVAVGVPANVIKFKEMVKSNNCNEKC